MNVRRLVAIGLGAALIAAGVGQAAPSTGAAALPPPRSIAWLDIGDSYGAGEGASGATGHCQRSANAAGPKAASILRSERGWTIGPQVFAACTGYLAADVYNSRESLIAAGFTSYGIAPKPAPADSELPNNVDLFSWAIGQSPQPGQRFDVITVSLGGNDIGFADAVEDCIDLPTRGDTWEGWISSPTGCTPSMFQSDDDLTDRIGGLLDDDPNDGFAAPANAVPAMAGTVPLGSLTQLYRDIADRLLAPDGVFVVMGYPRLITPTEDWGAWRGNQCNMVSKSDAAKLGDVAETFDAQLGTAIRSMGGPFRYVSRLEVFDDGGYYHSLCGRGVEWINTPLVFLRDGSGRKERGFHPNDLGYLATAEHVAGLVEAELGAAPPAPVTTQVQSTAPPATAAPQVATTPPTVRSPEAHFDIGDDFNAACVIAWPTAPARGVDSIQMRMSCSGVPSQFLFVDVVYGDPDLDVTPSRSRLMVHGVIADIVRSEFGFTTLVVLADAVEFID